MKHVKIFSTRSFAVKALFLFLVTAIAFAFSLYAPKTQVAQAAGNSYLKCYSYQVDVTVNADRTLFVKESIDMEFLRDTDVYGNKLTMFYKSLPKDSIYTDISAKCEENPDFSFYVEDNPDLGEFVDICCVGGVSKGARWVYDLEYTMEPAGEDVKNGIRLDVVGTGIPFELNDVAVTLRFPESPKECIRYTGGYRDSSSVIVSDGWSDGGKMLVLREDNLPLVYNDTFGEYMAEGITLEFSFENGVLAGYTGTKLFTPRTWLVLLLGVSALVAAVALYFFGKRRGEISTIVNIKAPDEMDPMQMGFLIDGAVNDEDVTSMIYYFASKGYLTIDFSDEDDPLLLRAKNTDGSFVELPSTAPVYQKTLFEGLFKNGADRTSVSSLTNVYYESVDAAKLQILTKKVPRYDKKSVACFFLSTLAGCLALVLAPLFVGLFFVGGGYGTPSGFGAAVFFLVAAFVWWAVKDLEFKKGKRKIAYVGLILLYSVMAIASLAIFAKHLLSGWEKVYLMSLTVVAQFVGYKTLSRTETYNKTLGDILGFKDFITVTEEDKIKFMLEENPELYFDVLPYAQVLDVTDEWEDKFKKITIEPPHWATNTRMTAFDYVVITRSMRRISHGMTSRPQPKGGTASGRSGGGGFGGFSGGGRGGGGFGAR